MDLKIDREFQEKIPPLTEEEFKQLRENILEDGEIYEPIIVWNGVIVDGHNRYRVIKEHPEIPYRVKQMDFTDKWAAFEWMYKKQLGRRNLTEEQRMMILGKMYEARKNTRGGQTGNKNAEKRITQTGQFVSKTSTAQEIAKELGIGTNTVRRAGDYAKGVDAIRAVSPEAAEKVLAGKSKVTRTFVQELPKRTDAEVAEVARAIVEDRPVKVTPPEKKEVKSTLYRDPDAPPVEYGLDDLLEEIRCVNEQCIRNYRSIMRMHKGMFEKNAAEVATAIQELVEELEKIEEEM